MQTRRYKPPKLPTVPASLTGYTDILRLYAKRLQTYYRRSYLSLGTMFDSGNGGLLHLFLLPDKDLYYIRFMLACYYLSEHSHVSRNNLSKLNDTCMRTIDYRIEQAKNRGHLIMLKINYYELSQSGHEYIQAVIKSYTDSLLEFYDLK